MNFTTAKHFADKIIPWLSPYCVRIELAGSIRRLRPVCNDVDIVCIPKVTIDRDLLGGVSGRTNHLLAFLQDYVKQSAGTAKFQSGGDKEGKQVIVQLPKCQLDLWYANEDNIGTRLLCRTGSKEHNILLAARAQDMGGSWNPYEGVTLGRTLLPARTEADVYSALQLPFIEPQDREGENVARIIRSSPIRP